MTPSPQARSARSRCPQRLKPIALACLTGMLGSVAFAAEPDPQQLETVIVTGIRKSLDTSLELKRKSKGLVDGIVAEDIGKFPDTNLAESLSRISGVSIERNNGEGTRITVRGMGPDFNLVLLNG
ncbi:MAG: TonB-dependent receptor plug domain-containing protein, partial [Inhella sp.]